MRGHSPSEIVRQGRDVGREACRDLARRSLIEVRHPLPEERSEELEPERLEGWVPRLVSVAWKEGWMDRARRASDSP